MPIEHTLEFYERVELLRLEKKGENFAPKLFNKVINSCLKNCYPNLEKKQIKKYDNKIFFVLVDKKPAKDTHLLNPYGFFTIKVESENDINKVVIYDLCKSFQGEDNDIICRIMLRKFIEHLEKISFQLKIKEANNENNLLIHEIIIYVSKNKDDKLKISCYNEVGFKSEDETLIMQNNNEEEEFEKYKLPLPPSKFLEKNNNQGNTNKNSINYSNNVNTNSKNISNSVNKEPQVLKPENISEGNNLGTITGQLEEIINNEKANMEKEEEENNKNIPNTSKENSSETKKNTQDVTATNSIITNLSNGFSSVETNKDKEDNEKLQKSTIEQEEIDEKEKNSSFFGNITSAVSGFMSGSSSSTNTEQKEEETSVTNTPSNTPSNITSSVSNAASNTTSAVSSAASNTASAVSSAASNTMQSAQNLFSSNANSKEEQNNNSNKHSQNNLSQPNENSQNNNSNESERNNISVSISENTKNSEEQQASQPIQQQKGGNPPNISPRPNRTIPTTTINPTITGTNLLSNFHSVASQPQGGSKTKSKKKNKKKKNTKRNTKRKRSKRKMKGG